MKQNERIYVDFRELGFPIQLGRVDYARAHRPLLPHTHEGCMEFVYVARGRQYYSVGGAEYEVNSGELFFTLPDEPHSSSGYPEEKALFYYIVVDAGALAEGFVGFDAGEGRAILQRLTGMKRRVFRARADAKRLLDGMLACAPGGEYRFTLLRNHLSGFLLGAIESEGKRQDRAGPTAMQRVLEYIRENVDEEIPLISLARIAGLSLPRFKSSFRSQMGVPPGEYVLRCKVERAKAMLRDTALSVTDVAYRLQFSSSQYFATVFKRFVFATPTEYRKSAVKSSRQKE